MNKSKSSSLFPNVTPGFFLFALSRMAYLKKHAIVHQYSVCDVEKRLGLHDYSGLISNKDASHVANQFKTMLPEMEQHHLHQIRELYYQQRECLSAFQFVQNQTFEKTLKK